MAVTAPLAITLRATVPAAAQAAAGAAVIGPVPFAGTVIAASYTPVGGITGHDSNTRTVTVINKGAAGSGTDEVAEAAFVAANSATAYVPEALTLDEVAVAAGDVLAWASTYAASGTADPGGVVAVTISRS